MAPSTPGGRARAAPPGVKAQEQSAGHSALSQTEVSSSNVCAKCAGWRHGHHSPDSPPAGAGDQQPRPLSVRGVGGWQDAGALGAHSPAATRRGRARLGRGTWTDSSRQLHSSGGHSAVSAPPRPPSAPKPHRSGRGPQTRAGSHPEASDGMQVPRLCSRAPLGPRGHAGTHRPPGPARSTALAHPSCLPE